VCIYIFIERERERERCLLNYSRLCLPPAFTLVSCWAYSFTQKMEATYSFEMSTDFQRTTRRYIPEDRTLQLEQITSCLFSMYFARRARPGVIETDTHTINIFLHSEFVYRIFLTHCHTHTYIYICIYIELPGIKYRCNWVASNDIKVFIYATKNAIENERAIALNL
jgi:hypothetical protein